MGAGGARVRCPQCGAVFVVAPESRDAPPAHHETPAAEPAPETSQMPETLAASLLAAIEERLGARFEAARRQRRVLADCGRELLAAWDAFREQAGEQGSAEVFRAVLRERWSVDLEAPRIR
jgi:hypothetical protein